MRGYAKDLYHPVSSLPITCDTHVKVHNPDEPKTYYDGILKNMPEELKNNLYVMAMWPRENGMLFMWAYPPDAFMNY